MIPRGVRIVLCPVYLVAEKGSLALKEDCALPPLTQATRSTLKTSPPLFPSTILGDEVNWGWSLSQAILLSWAAKLIWLQPLQPTFSFILVTCVCWDLRRVDAHLMQTRRDVIVSTISHASDISATLKVIRIRFLLCWQSQFIPHFVDHSRVVAEWISSCTILHTLSGLSSENKSVRRRRGKYLLGDYLRCRLLDERVHSVSPRH